MTIEEFKNEVLPLRNKLFRFAKRLLNVHAEAEDITQDVFLKLWLKKTELSNYKSIEALAMTITKNLCFDRIKLKSRKVMEMDNHDMLKTEVTPYEHSELKDRMNRVNYIINTLPDRQKMIIQLRDVEGYTFEEIEEMIGLNINAIRVNLSRARKKIRAEICKTYDYGLKSN